jgi:hypothetical protein
MRLLRRLLVARIRRCESLSGEAKIFLGFGAFPLRMGWSIHPVCSTGPLSPLVPGGRHLQQYTRTSFMHLGWSTLEFGLQLGL